MFRQLAAVRNRVLIIVLSAMLCFVQVNVFAESPDSYDSFNKGVNIGIVSTSALGLFFSGLMIGESLKKKIERRFHRRNLIINSMPAPESLSISVTPIGILESFSGNSGHSRSNSLLSIADSQTSNHRLSLPPNPGLEPFPGNSGHSRSNSLSSTFDSQTSGRIKELRDRLNQLGVGSEAPHFNLGYGTGSRSSNGSGSSSPKGVSRIFGGQVFYVPSNTNSEIFSHNSGQSRQPSPPVSSSWSDACPE